MATVLHSLRCPACGMGRRLRFFGIEDGDFRPAAYPQHVLECLTYRYGGDRSISVVRQPVTLQEALALRDCLAEALRRVEEEIAETGEPIQSLLADRE